MQKDAAKQVHARGTRHAARKGVPRAGLRALLASALLAGALAAGAAEIPRADDPGHLTPADKAAMLAIARRIAQGNADAAFDPEAMPSKLLRSTGRPLILSAHWPGREPAIAFSTRGTLLDQLNAVGRKVGEMGAGGLRAARLKLDVVASAAPLNLAGGAPPAVGLEGLWLRTPHEELLLPPSEALRLNVADGEAFVRRALGRLRPTAEGLRGIAAQRFQAVTFIERQPGGGGGPPLDLFRGKPLVEAVSPGSLLAACEAAGDYLLRSQKPDGTFHYLYDAARDAVVESDYEPGRHAGAAWSLAQLYGATGRRRFRDAAARAIEWLLPQLRSRGEMAWLEQEGEGRLDVSALALIALLEFRSAAATRRHDDALRSLGRFLAFMQRPDGFFHTHYDPGRHEASIPAGEVPLFAPGEAFFALVRLQRALPDPAWERAAARAAEFMTTQRDAWYHEHDLRMIHPDSWTMQALDAWHAQGRASRAQADYCLFLAHAVLEEQETPATARWLDHVGAPRTSVDAPNSAVAAGRAEGLLAAWRLAGRLGAAQDDYRQAITLSARFQLAHQYGAANSYLLPNPARARGGFHASYLDHTIRIDYVQHNIAALLGAARVLLEAGSP